ncbi:MAG: hypothetical protein ABI883_02665, partial [Chthoniobacterales bacterium]
MNWRQWRGWRPAQICFSPPERAAMRLLFALVMLRHLPHSPAGLEITVPNGFARLIDLHWLLGPQTYAGALYLSWIALVLYVLRLGWSLVLPYLTFLSIAVGSVVNSAGAIGHTMQIVSLVLSAQTAAHFYGFWRRGEPQTAAANEDRLIFWSQQAIVATYVVSALTKLIRTSGMWFVQSPLIALQIVKTNEQIFYNLLREPTGNADAIASWLVQHPALVCLVLSLGLLLELGTPLALCSRRLAACYGLSLLVFH